MDAHFALCFLCIVSLFGAASANKSEVSRELNWFKLSSSFPSVRSKAVLFVHAAVVSYVTSAIMKTCLFKYNENFTVRK